MEQEATQAVVSRQAADERLTDTVRDRDELSGRLGSPEGAATVARQLKAWKEVEKDVGRAQEAVAEARKHPRRPRPPGRAPAPGGAAGGGLPPGGDTVVGLDRPPPGTGRGSASGPSWLAGRPGRARRVEEPGRAGPPERSRRRWIGGRDLATSARRVTSWRSTCKAAGPAEATADALGRGPQSRRAPGERPPGEELGKQKAEVSESRQVAAELGDHLRAERFGQWLLDEVVERLVDDATATLTTLSGSAYSLTLDEQGRFAVIDHANADAVRPARTLSGGETFRLPRACACPCRPGCRAVGH